MAQPHASAYSLPCPTSRLHEGEKHQPFADVLKWTRAHPERDRTRPELYSPLMPEIVRFPPLPPTPDPPAGMVDARQSLFGDVTARLGEALDLTDGHIRTANVASGYPASAVNLGHLQDMLEAALYRFDMTMVRERWDVDLFAWIRRVLLVWIQRCKLIEFDLDGDSGLHIRLETQDDRGYYHYEVDVFPGRTNR